MADYKLDREAARKAWIEALRSGEYAQTQEQLRRLKPVYKKDPDTGDMTDDVLHPVGFCCLGAACDLYLKLELPANTKWDGENFVYRIFDDGSVHYIIGDLPIVVQGWLGLISSEGKHKDGKASLAERNDAGADFNSIAADLETGNFWCENHEADED